MESDLLAAAAVRDAQPCRSGLFKDPLTQRHDLCRVFLVPRTPDLLVTPGRRLKRPADKLKRILYVNAVFYRGVQRPLNQSGQLV